LSIPYLNVCQKRKKSLVEVGQPDEGDVDPAETRVGIITLFFVHLIQYAFYQRTEYPSAEGKAIVVSKVRLSYCLIEYIYLFFQKKKDSAKNVGFFDVINLK